MAKKNLNDKLEKFLSENGFYDQEAGFLNKRDVYRNINYESVVYFKEVGDKIRFVVYKRKKD